MQKHGKIGDSNCIMWNKQHLHKYRIIYLYGKCSMIIDTRTTAV